MEINTADTMTDETPPPKTHNIAMERLKSIVERYENLEEEKKALGEDVRDVYAEAKGAGFDPKIMRKLVSMRKQSLEKRREEAELLELYASAIQYDLGL